MEAAKCKPHPSGILRATVHEMGEIRRQPQSFRLQGRQEQALPLLHPHRRQESGARRFHVNPGRR